MRQPRENQSTLAQKLVLSLIFLVFLVLALSLAAASLYFAGSEYGQGNYLAFVILLIFGLTVGGFAVFGGKLVRTFWSKREKAEESISQSFLSSKLREKSTQRIFGTVFVLVGLPLLWVVAIQPLKDIARAKHWEKAPAIVETSKVRTHSGDDGDTYSIAIRYRYTYKSRSYMSERYSFFGGSTSGYSSKARIVEQYPPGRSFTCFVNPEHPAEAVIERQVTSTVFFGFIPLVFIVLGLAFVTAGSRKKEQAEVSGGPAAAPHHAGVHLRETNWGRRSIASPELQPASGDGWPPALPLAYNKLPSGEVELTTMFSAKSKSVFCALGAFGFILFLFLFAGDALKAVFDGRSVFTLLPFTPLFVIEGALLLGAVYFALAHMNPRISLVLNSVELPLGSTLRLRWSFTGKTNRLQEFRIVLAGDEIAEYRQGTSTSRDRERFFEQDIVYRPTNIGLETGEASLVLPHETVPSFEAPNNQIRWQLEVRGEIPVWPDIQEKFFIILLPARERDGAA